MSSVRRRGVVGIRLREIFSITRAKRGHKKRAVVQQRALTDYLFSNIPLYTNTPHRRIKQAEEGTNRTSEGEDNDGSEINAGSSRVLSAATSREEDDDSSNNASSESKSPGQSEEVYDDNSNELKKK
ncbi:hypothetical protein SFRURICE_021009 [Spodoptera frugiperda]|nr:hypothetical protein SFRURICE_021009 [Spodoptera frugiperda]